MTTFTREDETPEERMFQDRATFWRAAAMYTASEVAKHLQVPASRVAKRSADVADALTEEYEKAIRRLARKETTNDSEN